MGILIAQLDPQGNLVEALQALLEADLKVLLSKPNAKEELDKDPKAITRPL
jgi:hypothetical protein